MQRAGWWGLRIWPRVRIGVRCVAVLSAMLMVLGSASDGLAAPVPHGPSGPPHHAQPAPHQRTGSAAGRTHLKGKPGKHATPETLRSRYPLHKLPAAPTPHDAAFRASVPDRQVRGFDPATSRELPVRRRANQRVFANADGTQTTQFSTSPVNYRRPDGSWAPIDPRLEPAGTTDAGWRNTADATGLRLAGRADAATLARISVDSTHSVAFGLFGARGVAGRADGDTVTYPGVLPGVDLRLTSQAGGVKETLVLASAHSPRSFLFPLALTGLTASVVDGQVVLVDSAGRQRAVFPAGSMTDSATAGTAGAGPAASHGVTYRLVTLNDGEALQVTLDGDWLDDPARVFPVLVDPTVNAFAADAAMVVHGSSSSAGSTELLVGDQGGSPAASYLKFTGVASALAHQTIYGAQLRVVNFDSASCSPRTVTVNPVTQAWSGTAGFSYPGPAVGSPLASVSFAHGFIGLGQSRSACPTNQALFNLGVAGRNLVQGWVNGAANNGLSLRASATDPVGWKRFTGPATANPPTLYVTHSPYNAKYSIPNPVPDPPVLQNQAGTVHITVTNASAESWTPSTYYLAYRAYDATTGHAVTQQRAANLPGTLARGGHVTLAATIKALPVGKYFLDFTMVHTGGPVFTDDQVPPARIVLQVFDIPPVVQGLYPPNGYQAQTLSPQLWAKAIDIDAPPDSSLHYRFEVCPTDDAGNPVNCTSTAYQTSPVWTIPAGMLSWSKTYLWRAFVKDATTEVPSPYSAILAQVPQPEITSHVANAPDGTQGREFDPQIGNFSTVAVDAPVATVSPELSIIRTYNSQDPRTDSMFGAGWFSRYDMRMVPDNDGSGNVVVTYPDGEEVRFGKNPDGTFAAPQGRTEGLTFDGTNYVLSDATGTKYQFFGAAIFRMNRITDATGHQLVLTYDNFTGRLATAQVSNGQSNRAGRAMHFTWTGSHVSAVSTDPVDGAPLTWTYGYTGDLLTSVCAPDGTCTHYTYTTGSHYRSAVTDDHPDSYWRLGEADGQQAAASEVGVNLGKDHGTYHDVTLGAPGVLAGTDNTAATFNGTSSYLELPGGTVKKSRDTAVELWFKANPAASGGPLLGYQDAAVGTASTLGVPVLYQGTDGLLHGQFYNGSISPMVATTKFVNDGNWHHAVLSQMGTTQSLYLDGTLVDTLTNPATVDTSTLTFNQVGAAYASTPASWPDWGGSSQRFYNGTVDEVAVYSHPLGPGAVAAHYRYAVDTANLMSQVTLPSGKIASQVSYDTALDRVHTYTDRNGGTWTIGAPIVSGSDTDLRRDIEVLDPAGRPYLYEYDALTGRMVRSGTPVGLTITDEDKVDATPTPTPTPTSTCTAPDPDDPTFCTIIPPTASGPVFDGHSDGLAIRTYSYDDRGFQTGITDENGDTVTMTRDDHGNVTSKTTCRTSTECHTEFYTYPSPTSPFDPSNNLPIEVRDGRSASATDNTYLTSYTYRSDGQLLTETVPGEGTTRHVYTIGGGPSVDGGLQPAGLVANSTDPRGAVTRYLYYSNGDLGRITEPSGLVTSFSYDALGRKTSETEVSDSQPAGVATTYTYDALSRLVSTTEPMTTDPVNGVVHQGRTTNTYDVDGNLTKVEVTDLTGGDAPRVTSYAYDEHNRLIRVTDPQGHETNYGYDVFGNRTSEVDANGNHYEYGYTARNMLAEVRLRDWSDDPGGTPPPPPDDALVLHSYAYDFAGRLVSDTDAMGHEVDYAYYGDGLLKNTTLKNFHNPDGSTRDYVVEADSYDGAGNPTEQVTGNGTVVTTKTYDPAGQVLTSTMDPGGLDRTTTFGYDPDGNVTQVTASGDLSNVPWNVFGTPHTVTYAYDLAGNVVTETQSPTAVHPLITTHSYDQRGLLTSTTDPRGNASGADKAAFTTTYGYDEMGRQTTVTGPAVAAESDGNPAQTVQPTQTVGYDTFDEPVAVTDPLGNTTRTVYDSLGRPVTVAAPAYTPPGATEPIVPTSHTAYDPLGNVTSTTDPLGHTTHYTYDRLNRMVTRDEPGSTDDQRAVWHYTYTRTGDVLSVTDPTGARAESTYDDLDRQITATQVERHPVADNFTTRYGYDDAGDLTTITSPSGAVTTNTYDKVGELTTSSDPNGVISRFGYDIDGHQVRTTDGLNRTSRLDFDTNGRLVSEIDMNRANTPLRQALYGYDLAGNLLTSRDPLGVTTTYTYDAMNHLRTQTEPVSATASITTSFGYDAAGDRTRYTDGRGNSTVYTVNTLGLPEKVIVPATTAQPGLADRTWTASYDADARPDTLTAPGGVTRQRTFDAAGRLASESGSGAESATTDRTSGYDLAGRLTSVSAPGGTDTYSYDDRGDLLSAAGPSGTASFGYDADGNMTTRTDAAGTAHYGYVKGRLSTVADGATGTTQTLGYNFAGQPGSIDYGAGRVRNFGYDDLGRMSSDVLKNSANQTVSSVTYGYDMDDRLTTKTTTGTAGAAANTYGYDKAGRLVSWDDGSTTTGYAWDDSGNRISAGGITATYDERDRILTSGDTTYSYTARGTVASQTSSGLPEQFSFDAFDRMISDDSTTYTYDGLDRITSRDSTSFSYAGQSDAVVSDGTATYARGPMDELLAVAQGAAQRLTVSDQHGDVVGDFDPANTTLGALDDSTGYDPFGQVIANNGNTGNVGFQGAWTDPTSGQVDMGARFYDPGTGTFDSADSVTYTGGDSILANPYVYGAGDPLDNTDPTGNWPSCGWCHKVAHAVSHAAHKVAHVVYRAAVSVAHFAVSAVRAVVHTVVSAAQWVYQKAKAAVSYVASKIVAAARWVASKVAPIVDWAKQRAAAARQAAVQAAHEITRKAKQATAWAAAHNPLPVVAAVLKPVYAGIKHVVSATAHLPAAVVATVRDVVHDVAASVQAVYHQAVEAAGDVVSDVSTAVKVVSQYAKAALPMVAGIAAGALTTVGCLAVTGGAGSLGCVAAGFAVGGAVTSALNCPKGRSIAGCAATGFASGAVAGGVFLATGGTGAGLSAAILSGAASSGAGDIAGQLLTTGHVNLTETAESTVLGGATGGIGRGLASRFSKGCNSFAAGTGVLLADGTDKPIEDVRLGDKVLATNPVTGKTQAEPVTDVIVGHGRKRLVALTIAASVALGGGGVAHADTGSPAHTETLTATDGHPFWVADQAGPIGPALKVDGRWVKADDLRPGEWLTTPTGGHITILATHDYTQTTTVYNLTINATHTYYVEAGGTDVLVHNCGSGAQFVVDSAGNVTDTVGRNNSVSLGRYPAYLQDAQMSGSQTFNVGDAWEDMEARTDRFGGTGEHSEIWIRNSRFLDRAISKGSVFRLASDPLDPANAGSFFIREVAHLQSRGYTISKDRTLMLPPS